MTPDQDFARLLRVERLIAGLTQEQVVEKMSALGYSNFHQATVFKIEAGKRRVTVGEAHSLAQVLGIPLTHLLPATSHQKKTYAKRRGSSNTQRSEHETWLRELAAVVNERLEAKQDG